MSKISFRVRVIIFSLFSLLAIWVYTSLLLPSGTYLSGHDSGLALDSKAFLETRLFAWDERINFGSDNSLLFGSLTIHLLDFLTSALAGVPYAGNQVNLFFWLSLVFIAGLIFAYQLRQSMGNVFVFIFPLFVTLNFYIFQSLFILERAKYSLVAATLFFLAILISFYEKKISFIPSVIFISLIFSILNGGSWLGLPLFGGLFIITGVLIIFQISEDIAAKNFNNSSKLVLLLLVSGILFTLINSYSLFPYIQTFLRKDYQVFQNAATIDSNKAWLDYISQGSSFINIFRMQGVPDWYETKFTASPMHPFARFYLENPFMLILGFTIPILSFLSFIFVKTSTQRRVIAVSAVISLVSMFFMSASRSPWGFIYEFLYNNIPGFLIFRSSFYKFGYAFVIANSIMLAFTLSSLSSILSFKFKNVKTRNYFLTATTILIMLTWIFYHQKLLDNNIFKWRDGFSTKVNIPIYVNEYRDYVKEKNIDDGRVLILPRFHEVWQSDGYNWGYWSLSTLQYSLTKEPTLSNNTSLNPQERYWVDLLHQSILKKDSKRVEEITGRLGVSHLLLKMDAISQDGWSSTDNPQEIKQMLDSLAFLKEEKRFGNWILYNITSSKHDLIFSESNLIKLTETNLNGAYPFLINKRSAAENSISLDNFYTSEINYFHCLSCIIEEPVKPKEFIWSRLLPNSLIFPLKLAYENFKAPKTSDPKERLDFYFNLILKRSAEVSAMFFYHTHEAYVINNLKSVRNHLGQVIEITQQTSNPQNFSDAKDLLNNLETVNNLYIDKLSHDNQSMSTILKEEISLTIQKVNDLKKYYSPILDDTNQWSSKKVFEINISKTPYQLYLDETSLPLSPDGKRIYPQVLLNDNATALSQISSLRVDNWIPIDSKLLKEGKNKLTLQFPDPINLLQIKEQVAITTPEGKRNCYQGEVKVPPQNDLYLLKVKTQNDTLKFFHTLHNNPGSEFLEWNKAAIIRDLHKTEYFKYFYSVPSKKESFNFYICGEYDYLPQYEEFIIEELFTPKIIGVQNLGMKQERKPKITYKRINSTNYQVNVENPQSPYILIMNQRFSPLWEVKDNSTGALISNQPFLVDLYSMGWIIDSPKSTNMVIQYTPQEFFSKGVIVSISTLLGLVVLLVFKNARRKKE